ncbi:MAG: ComEC/Rec2 family competence protein [Alphaproteobacteria bacterium]|nr:ComEC/Rec2 family competence protein [Alphaproteobacteria bacterium]
MFSSQEHRWFLWWPIGMGLGIWFYFQLPFEPPLRETLIVIFPCIVILSGIWFFLSIRWSFAPLWRFIVAGMISVCIGFSAIVIRTHRLATPMLEQPAKGVVLSGLVREVDHPNSRNGGKRRFVLTKLTYENQPAGRTPTAVRLTALPNLFDQKPGDYVQCLVDLLPVPPPVSLYGYDAQIHSYFAGVGAVGRVKNQCHLIKGKTETSLQKWRYLLTKQLRTRIPGTAGEIAAALVTGDRSGIPSSVRQDFTDAGIAHILAISGLHISLIAGFVFFIVRRGLVLIPPVAERFMIKKWAACVTIVATSIYLAISGFGFPAQRAFIMTCLVMLGVFMDRNPLSMRSVALAATFILCIFPESILSISFQLSFAAVVALIAAYESGWQPLRNWVAAGGWYRRPIGYSVGVTITTIVATLATTPFVMATFNRLTAQAIMGNLLAIPLTSLWIMPAALFSVLSLGFGGADWMFDIWGRGIHFLVAVSHSVAGLPGSGILVASPPPGFVALILGGGLWICLWQKLGRWLGLVPIVLALLIINVDHHPHIYMAGDGSIMAYRSLGKLYASSLKAGYFFAQQWVKELGLSRIEPWPNPIIIIPIKPDQKITLVSNPYYWNKDYPDLTFKSTIRTWCTKDAIVLGNGYLWRYCRKKNFTSILIDRFTLKQKGTQFIRVKDGLVRVINLGETLGKRPWRTTAETLTFR